MSEIINYPYIPEININNVDVNEKCELLAQSIIGKENTQISNLISKVGNSDWVKRGLEYAEVSDGKCPFCQKGLEDNLKKELEDYFDETYSLNCKLVNDFRNTYESFFSDLIEQIKKINPENYFILKTENILAIINQIEHIYTDNLKLISNKIEYPSNSISILSVKDRLQLINEEIRKFNKQIEENNSIVKNITDNRRVIVSQVWRFISSELDVPLKQFTKMITGIKNGKEKLKNLAIQRKGNKSKLEEAIRNREAEITSITHTVNEINSILTKFANGIKQVFILTHNVYFHKEITFRGSRENPSLSKEAFWVIRKKDNESTIVRFKDNPIKTSYELLWQELRDFSNSSRVTVFNTLRRILEYYFNIVGGIDYEKCINEFDGEDKLL